MPTRENRLAALEERLLSGHPVYLFEMENGVQRKFDAVDAMLYQLDLAAGAAQARPVSVQLISGTEKGIGDTMKGIIRGIV